ncbi:ATPase [Clostridium novyi A str. 4570]|uniref:ATPase n=1 Tax=Clostridium novyi A str. 4570 TaxID=1444290 RepID=A0AA88ZP09_CLONO|nr:heavy metal translocating P-type ATPase [Clostridium novyi]KGN02204.1 ATPase [Clostridium novyi A str. 4570]
MGDNAKKEIILEGLCCANCAAKIERSVNKLEDVDNASLDFISKKLTIEAKDSEKLDVALNKAIKIVNDIEPDVKVLLDDNHKIHGHAHSHDHSHGEETSKTDFIKFGFGTVIFVIAMVFKFSFKIELALFLMSYILIGGEVVLRALQNILRGQVFDENFLMVIATIGAFGIKQFPEGVAVMLFYQIGEFFQDKAVERSRGSISALMNIRPDYANIKIGENIKKVSPEEVKINDIIVVKPGEKIPLDGVIIDGKSMLDTSALTGESVPREAEVGSEVLGGFLNKNGLITIKVTKEFTESTVSKILDLVQNASSKKASTENFITKFARFYTPVVVITAVMLAIIPPLVIQDAEFSKWLYRALIFLVVSCPCALVVSIPLSFFGGIGAASRNGVLVKGGNYLEALNNVETVIFDKTGTLTKGVFNVTEVCPLNGVTKEELLEYAAYAESYSNHPIATSILSYYNKPINKQEINGYNEIFGHGISIKFKGKQVLAGNNKLMDKANVKYNKVKAIGTIIYVAVDKQYKGYILISDEVKEDSKKTIQALKNIGVKNTVMLTGDSKEVGETVANTLGVDEVYTELLPNDKVEKLENIYHNKSSNGKIVFVGDGINDAPVLARADIGIAMGGLGSDAAIEAADVVIMTDEPSKIVTAIKIAKRTRRIVLENIIFALGVKLVVLILGATGIANMWEAVFADVGVALIAVLNAMRVLKYKD